ncbi:MAG: putative rRNA methylase, SpoU family [Parachlamydiales bacterium]|nr:putative rRNA methylase, SpoU family [Parachlamydiales bacterium]
MVAKEISSLQHPLVKKAVALRLEREAREKDERVLIAGNKLIRDLATNRPIEVLFYCGPTPDITAFETFQVTEGILKKITGLEEPDGWAAIMRLPSEQPLDKKDYLLILDQVSDPGNLGTLWRTALGLGWQGIWLTPGCVDPFNDKALRAAQGATFQLPFERKAPEKILDWVQKRKASFIVADLQGTPIDQCKITAPIALVLGHEGQGPGIWTKPAAQRVTIPIQAVESLNVACAGAILLYAMRPHR